MGKEPAGRERSAVPAQAAQQDDKKQAAERRRLEDELEDDEVFEALKSLHTPRQD